MADGDCAQRWDAEVSRMLISFQYTFWREMQKARESGMVPEGTEDVVLARAVIGIAADMYRPLSEESKRLAKALRR